MEQRLSVVTLGVSDPRRARRFYEEGLGWRASRAGNEEVAFFQAGGLVLALFGRAALAEDGKIEDDGGGFGGIALAHNVRDRAAVEPWCHRRRQRAGAS